MKNWTLKLVAIALLALGATALAQVETVSILSVDVTSPTSDDVSAWRADDSVGEVTVRAQAVDADGNPVEGAEVAWTVENSTPQIAWVVASSGSALDVSSKPVSDTTTLTLDGGTTNADGIATLTLDSGDAGDVNVYVEIDGVAGDAYRGGALRIVWF